MRTIGRSFGLWLLFFVLAALSLGCAYLVGYWAVFNDHWMAALSLDHMTQLPLPVFIGMSLVAGAFTLIASRLASFAKGRAVNPHVLIVVALLLWAALYVATYETFELMDVYPFAGLFVISFLLFRLETRVVAAILFGIVVLAFYMMSAKELGERDAERVQSVAGSQIEYAIVG